MTRRPTSARDAAEAAFKTATATRAPERVREAAKVPGVKETVSLRVDAEVIERFQEDGPGWQDRMAEALRRAAGL